MRRSALRDFLRGMALVALPLGGLSSCHHGPAAGDGGEIDQAMAPIDMPAPVDMAGDAPMAPVFDLSGDLADMCLALAPVTETTTVAGNPGQGADCFAICEPGRPPGYAGFATCRQVDTDGGASLIECTYYACGLGRRPEGLAPAAAIAACNLGAHFARAAHLEAASVAAFLRLADELAAHGAPHRLVAAARRSARDERRHHRIMATLARRHGAAVPAVVVPPVGERGLEAIATENEVEGCVGETWGAIVATWQSRGATDPRVRAAMRSIAVDETRHAELAWEVSTWASPRLSAPARRRIADARHAAVRALARQAAADPPGALVARAGLPSAAQARRLITDARRSLWSAPL